MTGDGTWAPCIGSSESQPLDQLGSPRNHFSLSSPLLSFLKISLRLSLFFVSKSHEEMPPRPWCLTGPLPRGCTIIHTQSQGRTEDSVAQAFTPQVKENFHARRTQACSLRRSSKRASAARFVSHLRAPWSLACPRVI